MTLEGRILRPILREMEAKRLCYEADAMRRKQQIYEKIPRVAQIDSELKTTALNIVKAAFTQNKDAGPMLGAVRDHNLRLQAERAEALVAAGYPYDYMEPHFDCEKCGDTGYIEHEPCTCLVDAYRRAQALELNQLLTVGDETFDAFNLEYYSKEKAPGHNISPYEQMEEVYNYCVEYAKHFGVRSENVFMTGSSGLGKTFLAACIAREVVNRGASVVYDTAFNIFARFEEEKFSRESGAGVSETKRFLSCDLLIVDDLGCEMITAFTVAVLYNLINTRLLSGKKTIFCANLSMLDIRRKYNAQIASRIAGDYLTLAFYGEDIRNLRKR